MNLFNNRKEKMKRDGTRKDYVKQHFEKLEAMRRGDYSQIPVPDGFTRMIFEIRAEDLANGIDMHFDMLGARPIENAGPLFEQIESDIVITRSRNRDYLWSYSFMPSYTWRGRFFGQVGPKYVKEVGLDFPNERFRQDEFNRVSINDDGLITLESRYYVKPLEVVRFFEECKRQVEALMEEVHKTGAMDRARVQG